MPSAGTPAAGATGAVGAGAAATGVPLASGTTTAVGEVGLEQAAAAMASSPVVSLRMTRLDFATCVFPQRRVRTSAAVGRVDASASEQPGLGSGPTAPLRSDVTLGLVLYR